MTPAQIQRQLSVNRKVLAELYEELQFARSCRGFWSMPEVVESWEDKEYCEKQAYAFHKESVKLVPKIAAIVELQKSLKKDYQYKLSMQRAERLVVDGFLVDYSAAWEKHEGVPEWQAKRDAEAKGQAAKDTGMSMAGEMY